jgi:hypothetical protein
MKKSFSRGAQWIASGGSMPPNHLGRRLGIWFFCIVLLAGIVFYAFVAYRLTHLFAARSAQQLADSAAMLKPENYVPAGIYLARLMQSDPSLWRAESGEVLPDWLPPQLGRVHLWEPTITPNASTWMWGGGGDDDLGSAGYQIEIDSKASSATEVAYVLSYGCSASLDGKFPARGGEYRFTIPKCDHLGEDEFVTLGLAELTRRANAYAAGTETNVYGDDPLLLRQRLLSRHRAVAAKLGLLSSGRQP